MPGPVFEPLPERAIRVALADDQPLLRQGFRMFLQASPGVEVVGEVGDGRSALELAAVERPDVMLMDVRMPGWDGITATEAIVKAYPDVRVLILTTFDLDDYVYAALHAGASGFLLKDASPDELISAVRAVAAGDAVISPAATRRLLQSVLPVLPRRPENETDTDETDGAGRRGAEQALTPREREVLHAVARGLSNREIAAELFLSEGTVKIHVGRILGKLGLRDRVQAVVYAYETGFVDPKN